VLGGMDKIIIDQSGQGSGVVPYLPLSEMQRRPQTAPAQGQGASR
jgi:modulator of FtsH protease HflK